MIRDSQRLNESIERVGAEHARSGNGFGSIYSLGGYCPGTAMVVSLESRHSESERIIVLRFGVK